MHKHRIDFSAIRDSGGCTPLHRAVEGAGFNVPKVVSMLIEVAGVDVDARDQDGYTAAHVACTMRDADALTCLVAAGANLELANNIGNTPLLIFQFSTTVRIVTTLLAGGANVLARNTSGSTACHLACQMSHVSLPALLAFGANLDEPADNNGATPRQLLKTAPPTTEDIALARQSVHSVQLSLVRKRAFEICVALRSLDLDALCMCEILPHSCGPVAPFVPFYIWWQFVTKIKHWQMATQ